MIAINVRRLLSIGSLLIVGLSANPVAAQPTALSIARGDQVIVVAAQLSVYSQPAAQGPVTEVLTPGIVSRVLQIKVDQNNVTWFYLRSRVYGWIATTADTVATVIPYSADALQNMLAQATAAIAANPQSADSYLFRAEVIANQGQLALDESDFAQAISLSPADGRLYHYRARANQRIMGADQVLADSQRAIDLGWTLASGYDLLGTAYLDLQDYPAADRILTQAVSIAPDYAPAYNNHGVLFDKEGDVDNAIAQYTAAVTHDPLFVLGYNNRGWDLENQGHTNAALADFNTAIGIDSQCSNCWLNHGVFIANYRDDEKSALLDFSRAIEADPTNALAYANRAISYKALGNPDLEFADLSKAIALEPHSDVANLILGDFYAHQNIFSKAIAAYTIPIENNRGFVAVSSMSRGEVYLAMGRYDEAIADAQVCIASASRRDYIVAARLTSAAVYLYKHDYTSALKDYAAVWSDTTLVPFARYHANDSVTVLTDGATIRILALQLKIALDPGNAALFFQIAPLYMEYGRWQDGVNAYQTYFRLSNQTPPHDLSAILKLVVQ